MQTDPVTDAAGERPRQVRLQSEQLAISVLEIGAALTSVEVPDRNGDRRNVCLPLSHDGSYRDNPSNFGAVVGPFANRIGGASFRLDGEHYQLEANNGPNSLHSGSANVASKRWLISSTADRSVTLRILVPDDTGGFPGPIRMQTRYEVDGTTLRMTHTATTERPTVVNMTNHAYWNLAGVAADGTGPAPSVLDHELAIAADSVLVPDENTLPLGESRPVRGTAFDFTSPRPIGHAWDRQPGYDHCYVLRGDGSVIEAARVSDPGSGRQMIVRTNQPGVQLYTANHFAGEASNNGFSFGQAFCLECQNFPNAPNVSSFPSAILRPGETYEHVTEYEFGIA